VYQLPITAAQQQSLLDTLRTSHRRRIQVAVRNRSEKVIEQLDVPASQVLSGSVTVDATADITRSLSLVFIDPQQRLGFDAGSPARGALFADNLVSVEYGVLVPSVGWIDIPVFWGPVTNFERDRSQVTIEAQGKEALALDPHFATQGYTLKKGRRIDNAIRDVMDRVGETRYDLPDMPQRLPRVRSVQPEDEPWDVVKFGWEGGTRVWHGKGRQRHKQRVTVEFNGLISVAGNMRAFYNGAGRLCVRRRSTTRVLQLQTGRDLVTIPVVKFDALAARNHVVVTGAKVTVGKTHVQRRASASLAPANPLSPESLARNGHPRYMTEFVSVDGLKTHQACVDRARRILAEKSQDGLDLAFDCLPFPMLEEHDVIRVVTDAYAIDIPLRQFTIPLAPGDAMNVGYSRGDA
jgi:hypothetical protein